MYYIAVRRVDVHQVETMSKRRQELPEDCRRGLRVEAVLTLTLLLALGACAPAADDDPDSRGAAPDETSLARLTLWIPPDRQDDAARGYETELLPILQRHGLVAAPDEPGRATVDSAFCRLFAFPTTTAIDSAQRALAADSSWTAALHRVAASLDLGSAVAPLSARLEGFRTALGRGETTLAGSGLRQGLWHTFDSRDHPAFRFLAGVHRDPAGDLWLASSGAQVARFDGERLTNYDGAAYWACRQAVDDAAGGLWLDCGTRLGHVSGGSVHWLGRTDGLNRSPGEVRPQGLAIGADGGLWIAGDPGLAFYDGTAIVPVPGPDGRAGTPVAAVHTDADGNLWVSHAGGLSRWDSSRWTTYQHQAHFRSQAAQVIEEDARRHLWLGIGDGVLRFDGDDFEDLTGALGVDDEARGDIGAIAAHPDGDVWIGTNGGVVRFDGQTFTAFDQRDGVGGIQINDIHIDADGLVWVTTLSGGVSRWDGARIRHYDTRHGLPTRYVFDAARAPDGTLWFGTRGGLVSSDGTTFVSYTSTDGLSGDRIWSILAGRDSTVWAGSAGMGNGLTRIDSQGIVDVSAGAHGLPDEGIVALAEDGTGTVWVVARDGLYRLKGATFEPVPGAPKLTSFWETIPTGVDTDGTLWLVDTDGRAWRHIGDRFEPVVALGDHRVRMVSADAGGLAWVATANQLLRFDGERITDTFGPAAGAPTWVKGIFQDRDGRLWLSCFGLGVVQFDGRVFQTLSRRDGLSDNGMQAAVQDESGDLWLATDGGITRYRPSTRPPSVRITEVIADRTYGQIEAVDVSSSQDFVVVAFQGRSMTTPADRMAYVYRLAGIDADWRVASGQRAEYRSLPVGDHLFEVKAVDLDLNYSPAAMVRITVHPAYGQWALGLLATFGVLGTALGAVVAIRRRRERDETRALLQRERRRRMVTQTHEDEAWTFADFVETSPAFLQVLDQARRLQDASTPVLIAAESGTGKQLLARAMHAAGPRQGAAFVPVRCAALPAEVDSLQLRTQALSLLLGSVEGVGLILQADGGTLYLDEVSLLALPLQSHLLRILREGRLRRPGAAETQTFDVRVIASSSDDLESQAASGAFDAEFYAFLAQDRLEIPPLRERPQDIHVLAQRTADRANEAAGRMPAPLPAPVLQRLRDEPLPGNARELQQLVIRETTNRGQ